MTSCLKKTKKNFFWRSRSQVVAWSVTQNFIFYFGLCLYTAYKLLVAAWGPFQRAMACLFQGHASLFFWSAFVTFLSLFFIVLETLCLLHFIHCWTLWVLIISSKEQQNRNYKHHLIQYKHSRIKVLNIISSTHSSDSHPLSIIDSYLLLIVWCAHKKHR